MSKSIILTRSPKIEIVDTFTEPKGPIENLKLAKGPLQELTRVYNLTKPVYTLHNISGPPHKRIFIYKCLVEDRIRRNHFEELGEPAPTVKLAEHSAARKVFNILNKIYYFSEEKFMESTSNETYVVKTHTQDTEVASRIKLFKWSNCCEFCYRRGHTIQNCHKRKINKDNNK